MLAFGEYLRAERIAIPVLIAPMSPANGERTQKDINIKVANASAVPESITFD